MSSLLKCKVMNMLFTLLFHMRHSKSHPPWKPSHRLRQQSIQATFKILECNCVDCIKFWRRLCWFFSMNYFILLNGRKCLALTLKTKLIHWWTVYVYSLVICSFALYLYMWPDLQKGVTLRRTTFWDIEQFCSKINDVGFSIFLDIHNL